MSKGITVEEIWKAAFKDVPLSLTMSFETFKPLAERIYSALPEVLEPIEEEKSKNKIYDFLYFNYGLGWVATNRILDFICKSFGQQKLTEAELERILPKERNHDERYCKWFRWKEPDIECVGVDGIRPSCNCGAEDWNTCLKVIRENLRK